MDNQTTKIETTNPDGRKIIKLAGIIFLLVGLILLGAMIFIITSINKEAKSMDAQTTSTHVEINQHRDSEGDIVYSPIYTYEVDGQSYECASNLSTSSKPSENNQTIYYDSKNPSSCMSDFERNGSVIFLVFLAMPLGSIVVGISLLTLSRKIVKLPTVPPEDTSTPIDSAPLLK